MCSCAEKVHKYLIHAVYLSTSSRASILSFQKLLWIRRSIKKLVQHRHVARERERVFLILPSYTENSSCVRVLRASMKSSFSLSDSPLLHTHLSLFSKTEWQLCQECCSALLPKKDLSTSTCLSARLVLSSHLPKSIEHGIDDQSTIA
jgi:hypothetical protein